MIEEIKPRTLRALACDIEDCHNPQSWADYCRAAARIEAQAAEIARLRAEVATARREGMEEAARIATEFEIVAHLHGPWSDVADECAVQASREIAAAIRAAAKGGK